MGIFVFPFVCYGQPNTDNGNSDCAFSRFPVLETDSTRQRIILDSAAALLVGRWKLVQTESGWSAPRSPGWLAELAIDKQGECVVRIDGNWVSSFNLTPFVRWGFLYFSLNHLKGSLFFHTSRPVTGRFGFCESKMIMSDNRADGELFRYERITTNEPDIASLTPTVCRDSLSLFAEVGRVKGRVEFREELKAYVIRYSAEAGTDWVGIICNWPQGKEYTGQMLVFSGKYYTPVKIGKTNEKELIYYLRITGFHPLE